MDKETGSEFLIGYKKPPSQTRFKPGQSGNPSGRPKKRSTTFAESFQRELNTRVRVNEGGKPRQITKLEAITKQQTNKAVNGDLKATALVMRAVERPEFDEMENLPPLLHAMLAIHEKHEAADHDGTRSMGVSELAEDLANDPNQAHNDPD